MKNQYHFILSTLFISQLGFSQPGSYDPTLNIEAGANSYILETEIQPDGKIIMVGNFTEFNTYSDGRIDRINSNGTIDMSYMGTIGANAEIKAVDLQNDNKFIVGGNFTTFEGEPKSYIARLESDGTLDPTFTAYTNASVHDILYLSNGKIIIAGEFTTVNGLASPYIARLNSDGSLDASFSTGLGPDQMVRCVEALSDGKLIIAGDFSQIDGNTAYSIARLNSNGTHDINFWLPQVPNGAIYAIAAQPDGQVVISGTFTQLNGIPQNRISRLNTNGNVDFTFSIGIGSGIDGFYAKALEIQNDGKILVGGYFSAYNGTAINNLVRLNSDGSIDPTFATGSGPNSEVRDIKIQSDGKLIVSGDFSAYNGNSSNSIVRLNGGSLSIEEQSTTNSLSIFPNPSKGVVQISSYETNIHVSVYDNSGKLILESNSKTIDLSNEMKGVYTLKLQTEKNVIVEKLIIE